MLFGNSILQKEASFFHAQKRVKGRLHKILYTIFTRVENLNSILRHGIIPVKDLDNRRMNYTCNDEDRWDNRRDRSSFSIDFPNYRFFYKLRMHYLQKEWVVLQLNKKILWTKDCLFCVDNAARSSVACIDDQDKKGIRAFEKLYDEYPNQRTRQQMRLKKSYTTNPQAEILVLGDIEPDLISNVIFETNQAREKFRNSINSEVNLGVNSDLFKYRHDYEDWR